MTVGQSLFSNKPEPFAEQPKQACVVFFEADDRLLSLPVNDSSVVGKWGLPGGNVGQTEQPIAAAIRLLQAQINIKRQESQFQAMDHRFARLYGEDLQIHFYLVKNAEKPAIAAEHDWVSIYAFKIFDTIKELSEPILGLAEAFDVVYGDRMWDRVDTQKAEDAGKLIFGKKDKRVVFECSRRLVITLTGSPCSGKFTQANFFFQRYQITPMSNTVQFQEEETQQTALAQVVQTYCKSSTNGGAQEMPEEVNLGMMVKRLSEEDCKPGYLLAGSPSTVEQVKLLHAILLRPNDIHLPFDLEIPQETALIRVVNGVEEKDKAKVNRTLVARWEKFTKTQGQIAKDGSTHRLDFRGTESKVEVFHSISVIFQQKLDEVYEAEQLKSRQRTAELKAAQDVTVELSEKLAAEQEKLKAAQQKETELSGKLATEQEKSGTLGTQLTGEQQRVQDLAQQLGDAQSQVVSNPVIKGVMLLVAGIFAGLGLKFAYDHYK